MTGLQRGEEEKKKDLNHRGTENREDKYGEEKRERRGRDVACLLLSCLFSLLLSSLCLCASVVQVLLQ